MPRMTQAELNAYEARRSTKLTLTSSKLVDAPESDLHDQIISECRRRGWLYIHSRMDRPTTCGVGTPDFVIYGTHGQVYSIECKSRTGKLSTAQQSMIAQAALYGHTIHVVRDLTQFLALL